MSPNDYDFGSARPLGRGASVEPAVLVHDERGLAADLDAWGHAGHLVLLQRVVESEAARDERRGLFWCENCKLWLLARLVQPGEG
ncbi:MAG: hypothetical protein OXH13_08335 [Chloroflexi bacterium]|nr:hypothetical protein [Chloroflexota bacterium]